MQSNAARLGIGVAAIAVVVILFVVLKGNDDDNSSTTTPTTTAASEGTGSNSGSGESNSNSGSGGSSSEAPDIPTIEVKDAQPVGGIQDLRSPRVTTSVPGRFRRLRRDPLPRLRRRRGRQGRRLGGVRRPGHDHGRVRGRAREPGDADRRDHGQPVVIRLGSSLGRRPRAGRPPGPADPGVAVRLGGVAGPDRLVLRALGRLAHDRASRRPTGAPCRDWISPLLVNRVDRGARRGARRLPARGDDLVGAQGDRGAGPQLLGHLHLRHRLARARRAQRALRRRVPRLQPVAGDRPRGRRRASGWSRASRRRRRSRYPERLGRWPAVAGIVAFVVARAGLRPGRLSDRRA